MQGKNHVALALAIPMAGSYLAGTPMPVSAWAWGGLILGSLAPDIDGEGSICYLGNFLPQHITPKPVIKLLNWFGRSVSSGIRAIFGHRAALHFPLWPALILTASRDYWLLTTPPDWLKSDFVFWLAIGYMLHIAGDMLTVSGIPLFGPLSKKDVALTWMVTGKTTESVLGHFLWLFVACGMAFYVVPQSQWFNDLYYRYYSSWLPR